MDKFWERYIQSRPAPGSSKGAFDAFAAAHKEPRTMAQGGGVIGKPGGLVEPGVMYYGTSKKKTKKFKYKFKSPQGGYYYSDKPTYHHGANRPKGYIPAREYAEKYKFKSTQPDWLVKRGQPHQTESYLTKIFKERWAGKATGYENITRKYFFEKLKPVKVGGHWYVDPSGGKAVADDLHKFLDKETLNNTTVKAIEKILKDKKVNKLFQAGDYEGLKLALKGVKGITDAQRANGLLRISQLMSGTTFRNEMPKVELNKVSANKLVKGLEGEQGYGLYKNMWRDHKSSVIMKELGMGSGSSTYRTFVDQARKAIAKSLNMDKKAFGKLNLDINELTGLSSAYNNKTFSSSQFINLMDSELNTGAHRHLLKSYGEHEARLQRALKGKNPSEARQVIKDWKTWKNKWFHGEGMKGLDKKFRTKAIADILPDFKLGDDASKIYTKKRLAEFQKQNFPIAEEIKKFGYAKTVGDTKKARSAIPLLSEVAGGNKKALDFITKALEKQKVPKGERGFIATALLEDLGKLGLKGGRLLKMLELQYEPLFEGLFYQYAKKYKGYDHSLAREELFLPKMIAKAAPKLWEKLGFKPFKTGMLEGADPLIEKELYTHRDQREFVYFDGKEFKNPNFGKVIGERSQVKKYIDAQKAYQKEVDKYNKLDFELDMMTSNKLRTPTPPEVIEAKKKEIADQEELIIGLEPTLKPGTNAYENYMRAKEKQDFELGMGKIESKAESAKRKEKRIHDEYLEYKGGKQRDFYLPKGKLKERVEDPLYKKPYTFLETADTFQDIVEPGSKFWDYWGLTDKQVGPVVREGVKDKWEQIYDMGGLDLIDRIGIAGGVANMAQGGRAGYMGGGIAGIRRPNAIPPERQGLRSIMINGKKS